PGLITTQKQYLLTQAAERRAKLAALDRQKAQKEAERNTFAKTVGKIEALLPLLQQQVDMRRTLFEHQAGSKIIYIQTMQQLTAPVDGIVQQLAVHTVGGVVTPAQPVLVLVPADTHLEIEAMVPNRDIGFVHAGQEAEIKVETFSFTRYGLLQGHVISVSPDAIGRDNPQDQSNDERSQTAATAKNSPKGQDLVYVALIGLD